MQKSEVADTLWKGYAMTRTVIFDTETTGLPKLRRISALDKKDNWPDLVSICWRTFENGVETGKQYHLIKPMGWTIASEATAIHGITNEMAEQGDDLREVLTLFRKDITNADTIVAHNLDFDKNVILHAFLWRLNEPIVFWPDRADFCTAEVTKSILKLPSKYPRPGDIYKMPTLNELYEYIFHESAPPNDHSAERDVDVLQRIYWALPKLQ